MAVFMPHRVVCVITIESQSSDVVYLFLMLFLLSGCRAQFAKWAQTLSYPHHGRWERLQLVRLSSCGWDHPVLGWAARKAAVEAYCDVLHTAARRRTQATPASTSNLVSTSQAHEAAGIAAASSTAQAAARLAKTAIDPRSIGTGLAASPTGLGPLAPVSPGFEGLSLCLFRRVAKGETVFRQA